MQPSESNELCNCEKWCVQLTVTYFGWHHKYWSQTSGSRAAQNKNSVEFKMRTKKTTNSNHLEKQREVYRKEKQSTKTEETKVYFKYVRFTLNRNWNSKRHFDIKSRQSLFSGDSHFYRFALFMLIRYLFAGVVLVLFFFCNSTWSTDYSTFFAALQINVVQKAWIRKEEKKKIAKKKTTKYQTRKIFLPEYFLRIRNFLFHLGGCQVSIHDTIHWNFGDFNWNIEINHDINYQHTCRSSLR